MPIKYYKLFDILNRRGISKTELRSVAGITSTTASKLFKGETVNTETIEKICESLDLQPGDFMEYVRGEEPPEPPKPKGKDKEAKSETGIRPTVVEPKPFTIPEDKIPTSVYFEREDVEMPRGYFRYKIPMLNGGTESVIVAEDDLHSIEKRIESCNSYLLDDKNKVMGAQMINVLYRQLRSESMIHEGELAG